MTKCGDDKDAFVKCTILASNLFVHLFQKFSHILKQPHPGYQNLPGYFKMVAAISVVVFLILSILQPFNIGQRNINGNAYITAIVYAGGAALTMGIGAIWLLLFPGWFNNKNWTLGKDFIVFSYQLISIGFTIWAINNYRNLEDERGYGRAVFLVFTIGILPYALITFIKHNRYLKQSLKEAEQMNLQLKSLQNAHHAEAGVSSVTDHPAYLILTKSSVKIPVSEFLFAESKGNNLYINHTHQNRPKTEIMRCTINEFSENNLLYPSLLRCHRSYIINMDKVQKIQGNASGYQLVLSTDLPIVTVARSYVNIFKMKLDEYKS